MQLSRLEAFGFKSFMERLTLPLGSGITGVVGPNGCGKSNIVDALKWVLGETRASQLRGGVLEDVIFNGTEKLRPLGLAEVSVTIKASGKSLLDNLGQAEAQAESAAAPTAEQIATTTTEETSTSEQSVDNQDVPRLEVVSQEVMNEPAAENSDVPVAGIEGSPEAAAESPEVLQPETVQSEAAQPEGAVDFAAHQAAKFAWLGSTSEVQVTRRLYRSGESEFLINRVPCRLRDVKELFRVLGLTARGYSIIAQSEVSRLVTSKPEERRIIVEEAAQVAGFREQMSAITRRLEEADERVLRMHDIIKEAERQVSSLHRQAERARNRGDLKAELKTLEVSLYLDELISRAAEVQAATTARDEAVQNQSKHDELLKSLFAAESSERERLSKVDAEFDVVRNKVDALKDEMNRRAREAAVRRARVHELKSLLAARETEKKRLEERSQSLSDRRREASGLVETIESQERTTAEALQAVDRSAEEDVKHLAIVINDLRNKLRDKERFVRDLRDKMIAEQSRRDALQANVVAASPVTQLKKVLGNSKVLPREITEESRLLLGGLRVPQELSRAVQAILAEQSSFLVSPTPYRVAGVFMEHVLASDPKNKRGVGLGVFQESVEQPSNEHPDVYEFGGVKADRLMSRIEVSDWCRRIVARILKGVYVVPSFQDAIAFFEAINGEERKQYEDVHLVSLDGDIVTWNGFYSLRHGGGLVQLKSRIDEADAGFQAAKASHDVEQSERERLQAELASVEKLHSEALQRQSQANLKIRELSGQLGSLRGRLQAERRGIEQVEQDAQRLSRQFEVIATELSRLSGDLAKAEEAVQSFGAENDPELLQALQSSQTDCAKIDAERREGRTALPDATRKAEVARQELQRIQRAANEAALTAERGALALGQIKERVITTYTEEMWSEIEGAAQSTARLGQAELDRRRERARQIRNRIDREGDVDPSSIELYESEKQRLEDLRNQARDVEEAAKTLRASLEEVRERCIAQFVTTFEKIRTNFAAFGPILYGGGLSDLTLLDPARPLESGIEITVRPPGKKPKSIDLLSGGERALCAIALIFSMFMVKPSPACVLDEADAPLDEANVERFLRFIKDRSSTTQFLMITHNKASMTVCDKLVGVTMREPGASRVLMVSLQDAIRQVA